MNGVTGETADPGMLTLLSLKNPNMQPEELREGKLMGINEESVCDKKDEDLPEEVMQEKKNSQRYLHIFVYSNYILIEREYPIWSSKTYNADTNI